MISGRRFYGLIEIIAVGIRDFLYRKVIGKNLFEVETEQKLFQKHGSTINTIIIRILKRKI